MKRLKWKGPVYEISALTHDGYKQLARDIYTHIHAELCKEQPPAVEIDPRFAEIKAAADAATDATADVITDAVTDTAATAEPSAAKTRKPRAPRKTAS